MDAVPTDVGQNRSEAVCYSLLSSSGDSRCGTSRSLSAKSCARGDSDNSTVLSVLARALTFRIPIHFAGVFLLVHPCGTGNLLDRPNVRATCDLLSRSI